MDAQMHKWGGEIRFAHSRIVPTLRLLSGRSALPFLCGGCIARVCISRAGCRHGTAFSVQHMLREGQAGRRCVARREGLDNFMVLVVGNGYTRCLNQTTVPV